MKSPALWVLKGSFLFLVPGIPAHGAVIAPPNAPIAARAAPSASNAEALPFKPGEVLVAFEDGAVDLRASMAEYGVGPVAEALRRVGVEGFRELRRSRAASSRGIQFGKLTSSRIDFDPMSAADALRATGRFLAVLPNYRARLSATFPNDPLLAWQWYVHDPIHDADIQLPEAWDGERGDASTVIAIMDTGVDTGHPDLANKIWVNPGETPGNALDDDGNGYVDDVKGWDFGNDDNDPNPHPVFDNLGIDVGFHGTFVAGIAAAATNNGIGIAGSGWNCRLMPLKVVASDGFIYSDAIAEAFQYASDMNADVLNMSLGSPPQPGVEEFYQVLVDIATEAGVICVAGAGNDGTSEPFYPAANRKSIAVAATDTLNQRASFSNWGDWVDVAAPGTFMYSTICRNYEVDFLSGLLYILLFCWDGLTPYMCGDGTSFSTPLVSGLCGLLRSKTPSVTPQIVAAHLRRTGDALSFDHPIGRKVNAHRALITPVAVDARRSPEAGGLESVWPNPTRAGATISFTLARPSAVSLAIYDVSGRLVRKLIEDVLDGGRHDVTWDGRDGLGRPLSGGMYFTRLDGDDFTSTRRVVLLEGRGN